MKLQFAFINDVIIYAIAVVIVDAFAVVNEVEVFNVNAVAVNTDAAVVVVKCCCSFSCQ